MGGRGWVRDIYRLCLGSAVCLKKTNIRILSSLLDGMRIPARLPFSHPFKIYSIFNTVLVGSIWGGSRRSWVVSWEFCSSNLEFRKDE